ncbi:haloacid dehalogenase-like hydrolase [uncultured archaeon]|nr:haloacid dehalogenase-like hydrolase [uncultured archaeon]
MKKMPMEKLANIRLLALDFDGVLTDNRVLVNEKGEESVFCSRSDGYGISHVAKPAGIEVMVISLETNGVVEARCRKLGVECLTGRKDKLAALKSACAARGISLVETCFVGNDATDIECIEKAGFGVCVADAEPGLAGKADYVTKKQGGKGAVREVCELLADAKKEK